MYFVYTKNHPLVMIFTPFLVVGFLLLHFFLQAQPAIIAVDFGWFGNYNIPYWWSFALNALFICINSILINWIFNRYEFYERNTYVPSLVYISLISFFDASLHFSGSTLAQTFILLGLFAIYSLNQHEDGRKKAFNIGFFTGISVCLIPTYFPLGILSFFMLWTFRPFLIKEFLLLMAGLVTPFAYMLYISFWNKQVNIQDTYIHLNENIYLTINQYLPLVISAIALLFAWAGFKSRLQKNTVRVRRVFRVLYLLLLLGLFHLGVDFMFNGQFHSSMVITIPITMGLSLAATNNKLNRFTLPFLYIILLLTFFKFFSI